MMFTFDIETLEGGRDVLGRRIDNGRAALALTDCNGDETDATDIISDILTAVFGPAGVYTMTVSDTTLRVRTDALEAAEALLERAFHSWQGDSEDYTR